MYLQEIRSSDTNQSCLPNETKELEWRLNSTFSFKIRGSELILYNSYNDPHLTFARRDPSILNVPANSYQQWEIISINGKQVVGPQKSVFIGQTIEI